MSHISAQSAGRQISPLMIFLSAATAAVTGLYAELFHEAVVADRTGAVIGFLAGAISLPVWYICCSFPLRRLCCSSFCSVRSSSSILSDGQMALSDSRCHPYCLRSPEYQWFIGRAMGEVPGRRRLPGNASGLAETDTFRRMGRDDAFRLLSGCLRLQCCKPCPCWWRHRCDTMVYGQPSYAVATLFRPFLWGYLLLGAERGLAFFWDARMLCMMLVGVRILPSSVQG